MAVHETKVGADGLDHSKAVKNGHAPTDQDAGQATPQQRDHVQQLTTVVAMALKQRSRMEPVIVSRMQQRAELYEKAYVQAKQATIDAVARDALPAERDTQQIDALRKPDLEVLPPELVVKLAAADARQYSKLCEPEHRAAAALALANTARFSAGYRTALASTSAEVSAVVETAVAATDATKPGKILPKPGDQPGLPRDLADTPQVPDPANTLEPQALERVAARRARDAKNVAAQLGLNSIERVIEQKQEARRTQPEQHRTASKAPEAVQPKEIAKLTRGDNQVSADEVFTAVQSDVKPIVPAEVEDKYLRVGTKFYHPKYTHVVAFEDKGNQLETRSNSEQIAGAMVAIARARGWDEIKVAGSETFRKEVWLEAAAHGMHVKGYAPSDIDKAELAKRTRNVEVNHLASDGKVQAREQRSNAGPSGVQSELNRQTKNEEQVDHATGPQPKRADRQRARAFTQQSPDNAVVAYPELASAYAAMASINKKVSADDLSAEQRAIVMARVGANLVNSIERGHLPEIKVREVHEAIEARRQPAKDKAR